ncbi:hypothetical protein NIIDMKKI_26720 [Mycobacterium kansasii]|uniref:CT398-like coiled coil hairpin domain-containing protein n=1 Tax=Mycobacterium kansasii TaxID=1768 RepID=A0A7G1I938_MYCKA|nr:hypothetical protein NIIDMKKI_26720 [Mycobacterium kansasii]
MLQQDLETGHESRSGTATFALELAKLDAELSRIAHRSTHLPQREACERVQIEHNAAGDRLAAVRIAVEDLDAQVSRFEAEIDAVRKREERDRSLLKSGATDAKQLSDLQHELETLERRQASLEDSLLEVMERREELQARQAAETAALAKLHTELDGARQALDAALAELEQSRRERSSRREELSASLNPDLVALYERQRAGEGRAPDRCRVIDVGPAGSRSAAASWPGSRRPPTTMFCGARNVEQSYCGSRVLSSESHHRSRRRVAGNPGRPDTARWCGPWTARPYWRSPSRRSAGPPTTSLNTAG